MQNQTEVEMTPELEAKIKHTCCECLKDVRPNYDCVECAACGFVLCNDGCTRCLCVAAPEAKQ